MNTFALTIEARRFDAAAKARRLELVGIAERNAYRIAEMRGTIDAVALYCKDRNPIAGTFAGSSESENKIVIRWEK